MDITAARMYAGPVMVAIAKLFQYLLYAIIKHKIKKAIMNIYAGFFYFFSVSFSIFCRVQEVLRVEQGNDNIR